MINIGLIGNGGIAGVHLASYSKLAEEAGVIAICDIIPERAQGSAALVGTNLGIAGGAVHAAKAYTEYRDLIADPDVQAVDLCLPTDIHAEVAIASLEGGKHVLCEKPMALTVDQCDRMIAAAQASGRVLMIAQCIRFWPEYVYLKEVMQSGTYGKLTSAVFSRLSGRPNWAPDSWYLQAARSGGAVQDLHIHDADFILYLLGKPAAISVQGRQHGERIDFLSVQYQYDDVESVRAEGGWDFPSSFPFHMSFLLRFEGATVEYDSARCPLTVYPASGESFMPELAQEDAYTREIGYYLDCIAKHEKPSIVTPQDARESVRLVRAEAEAFNSGKTVSYH